MKFQFLPENFSRSENAPPFETRKIRLFEVERIFLKNKKMLEDMLSKKNSFATLEKANAGGRNNAKIKIAKSELSKAEEVFQKASALKAAVDVMYEVRAERKELKGTEQELEKAKRERERLNKSLESGVAVDKEHDKSNIEIQKEKNAAFKADFEKMFADLLHQAKTLKTR